MNWPVLILCVLAGWAMLRLLASDRSERITRIQNRLYAESLAEAQQSHPARHEIPTVGEASHGQIQ